jgi:hypothetical protein
MNLVDTNSFEYKYERLEAEELIKIVHNSRNFQALAVETAYIELQRRTLTPERAKAVNDDFNLYLKRKVARESLERSQPKEAPVRKVPVKQDFFTAKRVIGAISLTVLAVYFITLIEGDTVILHMMVDPSSYRPSFIFILIPYISIPVGAILFGLRKLIGWVMLASVMVYNCALNIYTFKGDLNVLLSERNGDVLSADKMIRNGIVIAFYLFMTVLICLPAIRAKFKATTVITLLTIALAIVFFALQAAKVV